MESSPPPSYVVITCDATKDSVENDLKLIVQHVRSKSVGILSAGDTVLVLGVLHRVSHPMGYQTLASAESFAGTNFRAMEDGVQKKVDAYARMLLPSNGYFENEGISIEVKVTAGFPIRQVVFQEVKNYGADWVVLDRHLGRNLKHYLNKLPCKVAMIKDDLSVEVLRQSRLHETLAEQKFVYSLSKFVSVSECQSIQDIEQSIISTSSYPPSRGWSDSSDSLRNKQSYADRSLDQISSSDFGYPYSKSGLSNKGESPNAITTSQIIQMQNKYGFLPTSLNASVLCASCGTRTGLNTESMKFSFSDIQLATNEFSKDNLLGEGGYGHVYKGVFRDGQQIAAKVRKEESTQGFSEFLSEVCVLSFARHKNIVMLLGYCCKERINILVYEYICNKSLDWHLFDKDAAVLGWQRRYAIAIGTAKGLRFLHDECRGGPIIHRDMRPSNILLTHEFVPMLGDFGLAKWKNGDETIQTRIMGTMGYLAPEYAEKGVVSVGTDVYAFGIVLLQLISGRKVADSGSPTQQPSLRQWAEPLIEKLALHEVIDPRLGESYDTYQLYLMAKAALYCVQRNPDMRPSIREVVRFLEEENDHFHSSGDEFVPSFNNIS